MGMNEYTDQPNSPLDAQDDEIEDVEEAGTVNPPPPEGLDEEHSLLLRGDAIGDTAYTHRWVLRSIHTITTELPHYVAVPENEEESIVELSEDVENAACDLWDMTVEKDVVLHILNLEEVDIVQLAAMIIEYSRSPRLIEHILGIIANIVIVKEGSEKVTEAAKKDGFYAKVLKICSSSDCPSIIEAIRLLMLMLWHKTQSQDAEWDDNCPLVKCLREENFKYDIEFILKNCLSDILIKRVLNFMHRLLFVPNKEMEEVFTTLFGTEDFINILIEILYRKSYKLYSEVEDELAIIYRSLACLYAFVDTPAAKIIVQDSGKREFLEDFVFKYLEVKGKCDSAVELMDACDSITCAVGLFQLFVPHLKQHSVLSIIGRILSVIYGQTHHYSVRSSNSIQNHTFDDFSSLFEFNFAAKKSQWESPHKTPVKSSKKSNTPSRIDLCWSSPDVCNNSIAFKTIMPSQITAKDDSEVPEHLKSVVDTTKDFCHFVFHHWWNTQKDDTTQKNLILESLDRCHVHEVIFILDSVRKVEPLLVPKLQEYLLDNQCHLRLVAILAHMYQ